MAISEVLPVKASLMAVVVLEATMVVAVVAGQPSSGRSTARGLMQ